MNENAFVGGKKYRLRGVEIAVLAIGAKSSPLVEALFEVTLGPMVGRRIKWRGFLSEKAHARTIEELRLTGWRGRGLGDWSGFGSVEVEGVCVIDEVVDDGGTTKRYPRVSFLNRVATLAGRKGGAPVDLEALNRGLGLSGGAGPRAASAGEPPPGRFDDEPADVSDDAIPF